MKKLLKFALVMIVLTPFMVSCSDDDDAPNTQLNSAAELAGEYSGVWTKQVNVAMSDGTTSEDTYTLDGRLTFVAKENKIATMTTYAADADGNVDIDCTINVNVLTFSDGISYFNEYDGNGFTTADCAGVAEAPAGMKIGGILSSDKTITSEFSYEIKKKVGRKTNTYTYTYTFNGQKTSVN